MLLEPFENKNLIRKADQDQKPDKYKLETRFLKAFSTNNHGYKPRRTRKSVSRANASHFPLQADPRAVSVGINVDPCYR